MIPYWSPEAIVDLSYGGIISFGCIYTFFKTRSANVITLQLFLLCWLCTALIFVFEGLSFVFLDLTLNIISSMMNWYAVLFISMAINYTLKEDFNSPLLLIVIGIGALQHVFGILPGSTILVPELGFNTFVWVGVFNIIGNISYIMLFFLMSYLGIKAWKYSPLELRHDANSFLSGVLLTVVGGGVSYFFTSIAAWMIYVSDSFALVGSFVYLYIVIKEPRLCYILPFSIYRLTITDKKGNTLYTFDWARTTIKNAKLARYIDEIESVSDHVSHIGGTIDLSFEAGVVLIRKGDHTTTALVASRSSRVLRDALNKFSKAFEARYKAALQEPKLEKKEFDTSYTLIQEHFSNFPSRMITSKSQQLFISGFPGGFAPGEEEKLKGIIKDDDELELVKKEMEKTPKCVPDAFIKLYEEMKDEIDEDKEEDASKEGN